METTSDNTFTIEGFENKLQSRFANVYANDAAGIVVCVLHGDYVPIEFFKDTFNRISEVITSGSYHKFVFDKRSLRTFHQPSMEWYYIHWKKDMLAHGVKEHRKILPEIDWFKKAVMIAKDQLMEQYPSNVIDQLNIKYCDSIEEAIAS